MAAPRDQIASIVPGIFTSSRQDEGQPRDIAQSVMIDALAVVLMGLVFGITLGITSVRFIEALLFDVKATDLGVLALPAATIFAVALLAALPAVVRAVRIDPVTILGSE